MLIVDRGDVGQWEGASVLAEVGRSGKTQETVFGRMKEEAGRVK
jgi:hypothetical protein